MVFVALIYIDRRFRIGHGRLFALYVAGYCLGRFFVELMRTDAATHIAGIRINSFTATLVLIGAVIYFLLAPKGREDLAVNRSGADGEPRDAALGDDPTTARIKSGGVDSAAAPAAHPTPPHGGDDVADAE